MCAGGAGQMGGNAPMQGHAPMPQGPGAPQGPTQMAGPGRPLNLMPNLNQNGTPYQDQAYGGGTAQNPNYLGQSNAAPPPMAGGPNGENLAYFAQHPGVQAMLAQMNAGKTAVPGTINFQAQHYNQDGSVFQDQAYGGGTAQNPIYNGQRGLLGGQR